MGFSDNRVKRCSIRRLAQDAKICEKRVIFVRRIVDDRRVQIPTTTWKRWAKVKRNIEHTDGTPSKMDPPNYEHFETTEVPRLLENYWRREWERA